MAVWQPSQRRAGLLIRSSRRAKKALPIAVWLLALVALVKLAEVTPSAQRVPGIVDTTNSIVLAPVEGRVAMVSVQLHQPVVADQVIARLDDRDLRLRLTQASYELERLRADMTRVQSDLDREAKAASTEHNLDAGVEHRRLATGVETAQLGALSTRADLEEARIRWQGAAVETERLTTLATQGMIGEPELVRVRTDRDALKKRIQELEALYDEHRASIATARQRLTEFAPGQATDVPLDTAMAPLRWRLKQQEAQIERLALDAQALDLRAPISGHIASLDVKSGEWATAGRTIATIVDPTPRRIRAYVPDTMRTRLQTATTLQVQRADSSLLGATTILSISPTVVRVPERLWRDPQREEWGYEVLVTAIGTELPGERVHLAPRN